MPFKLFNKNKNRVQYNIDLTVIVFLRFLEQEQNKDNELCGVWYWTLLR
jgi:hypothetical protein